MIGEPTRLTALCRNHENVHVSVVFTGKRNPIAIRREHGTILDTRSACKPNGRPAAAWNAPKITRISECDVRSTQGRLTKKHRGAVFRGRRQTKREGKRNQDKGSLHFSSPVIKN